MRAINCLLLEDDQDDQQLFLEALHDIHDVADCLCVQNGIEGLAMLRGGFIPDVIFTDYQMPEMNGHEFLLELKRDAQLQKIPVYVFTSAMTDSIISQFRSSGAEGIYPKSTFSNLRKTIHQSISMLNKQTIL